MQQLRGLLRELPSQLAVQEPQWAHLTSESMKRNAINMRQKSEHNYSGSGRAMVVVAGLRDTSSESAAISVSALKFNS